APNATDRIQRPALQAAEQRQALEMLVDEVARLVEVVVGCVHQAQRTEREGCRLANMSVAYRDHVEAAAAEVGSEAVRVRNACQNAFGGDSGFVFTRKDFNGAAERGFGAADE